MITFSRTMLVGAEFPGEDLVRFHGMLEDRIYAMEIIMDVRISDGVVQAIQGRMKRFTTPVCPKAVELLQGAVGMSLRESGWVSKLNKEVGRKGCQHFAEILVECGRCLDAARMAHELSTKMKADPEADQEGLTRNFLATHPELRGKCMARPQE